MASIDLATPTRGLLRDFTPQELTQVRKTLTYVDKRVEFELRRVKNSSWMLQQLGEDKFRETIADLKARRKGCLLHEDGEIPWVPSGLAPLVSNIFVGGVPITCSYERPEFGLYPWTKVPTRKPRPYQVEACEKLIAAMRNGGPASVSLATGLGKTFVQMLLAKQVGLQTVLMVPSKSIARQTFEDFTAHLGASRVGLYGDGRKDLKFITIAIDDSLARVEPGSDAQLHFAKTKLFMADESHLTPANTLRDVCEGLLANAPYRCFLSGSQLRTDGLDMVLEGIIGPIVMEMSVRDGVAAGYLAKPQFTMFHVRSDSDYNSSDALKMTRRHFLYNDNIVDHAAALANFAVGQLQKPVLILIEEVEQFAALLSRLTVGPVGFAHGTLTKDNRGTVPEAYWKSDPKKLVAEFNAGRIPLLVGTSCVSTGTDFQNVQMIIRLKGKASEIACRQDTGRGTRLAPEFGKTDFHFVDYDVVNIDDLHRHATDRLQIYNDIYGPVREVQL